MTVTATQPNHFRAGDPFPWEFTVVLRREKNAPELKRVPVAAGDVSDALSEVWRDGCLRKGLPDVPLSEMLFQLAPKHSGESTSRCEGFVVLGRNPRGDELERVFTIDAFKNIAVMASQSLIKIGVLQLDDEYYFEVSAAPRAAGASAAVDGPLRDEPMHVVSKRQPLVYLKNSLAPIRERAKSIGPSGDGVFPVFYTQRAFAKAEQFARRGAERHPPVETGGVLVGPLCSCPETGELFAVVCDVIELVDADENKFSLAYSGKTWSRIQTVMRARQAQQATRAYRILGQCHGHNFLPAGGAPPCELCANKPEVTCARTSVFVSSDDRLWSQAVFTHQPWQLCHIFGLNARQEKVHALFGLNQNQLLERGFHLIEDFAPADGK